MAIDTMKDLLVEQMQDLHSAEGQVSAALPGMADMATNDLLASFFRDHHAETQGQLDRIEKICEWLGTNPRGKTSLSMTGLLADGRATQAEAGNDLVSDAGLIARAQRIEHFEIAAYGAAKAIALTLGHDAIVELLDESLMEELAADRSLAIIAEEEVNPEALMAGVEDEDVPA